MLNNNMLLISSGGGNASIIGPVYTAPSGREYARHESGMGSVMFYADGTDRRVLVLDAIFRGSAPFTSQAANVSSLPAINIPRGLSFCGLSVPASQMTDAMLNSVTRDPNTSRYNCNIWMRYAGMEAVRACRKLYVDGEACDLPNCQLAARIMCDSEFIDSIDPTVGANPTHALAHIWGIGSRVHTSTKSADSAGYPIYVYPPNNYYSNTFDNRWIYTPVLELAA